MDERPLNLTRRECLYLQEIIPVFAGRPGIDEKSPGNADLMLKIMSAFLSFPETEPTDESMKAEAQDNASIPTTPVYLCEYEVWVIREVAKSGVLVGPELVGLNLARKCAAALVTWANAEDVQHIAGGMPDSNVYDDVTAEMKKRLAKLREENSHADESARPNRPDDSATEGPCAAV